MESEQIKKSDWLMRYDEPKLIMNKAI